MTPLAVAIEYHHRHLVDWFLAREDIDVNKVQ